jgi:hypothetical protein
MNENKIISNKEAISYLMRKLNEIAIHLQKKECEKILYIISRIENVVYFPSDIRMKSDYEDN